MKNLILTTSLLFWITTSYAENNTKIIVGDFSNSDLTHWEEKQFSGKTTYQLVKLEQKTVLKAISKGTASGLFKKQTIDLKKTPYLNWSWRIQQQLGKLNEKSKSGDDYSARIYVVIDGGWAFWKTQAINYVWSDNLPKQTVWKNAFAGSNAMMIAVRAHEDPIDTWHTEKRNILNDIMTQFGTDMHIIDAIAIMTDTDNSQRHAMAYYGDIYFSAD